MTLFNLSQTLQPLSSVNIIQRFSLSLSESEAVTDCMMISHSTHDFIHVKISSVLNLEVTMVTFTSREIQNAFRVK